MKREEEEKNLEKENANLRDQINVRKRQIHDDIRIIEQLEKKIKMAEDEIEEMKRSFNIQFGGKDNFLREIISCSLKCIQIAISEAKEMAKNESFFTFLTFL